VFADGDRHHGLSGTVSTIDDKRQTNHPDDIAVGTYPSGVAITRCRRSGVRGRGNDGRLA